MGQLIFKTTHARSRSIARHARVVLLLSQRVVDQVCPRLRIVRGVSWVVDRSRPGYLRHGVRSGRGIGIRRVRRSRRRAYRILLLRILRGSCWRVLKTVRLTHFVRLHMRLGRRRRRIGRLLRGCVLLGLRGLNERCILLPPRLNGRVVLDVHGNGRVVLDLRSNGRVVLDLRSDRRVVLDLRGKLLVLPTGRVWREDRLP